MIRGTYLSVRRDLVDHQALYVSTHRHLGSTMFSSSKSDPWQWTVHGVLVERIGLV
jgi:hypothetical protein